MGEYADWAIEDELDDIIVSEPKKEKKWGGEKGYQKDKGYIGVYSWLKNQWLCNLGKNYCGITCYDRLVLRYGEEVLNRYEHHNKIANYISENCWKEFMQWVKDNYTLKRYKK
jgi:hypothetical protein